MFDMCMSLVDAKMSVEVQPEVRHFNNRFDCRLPARCVDLSYHMTSRDLVANCFVV